MWHSSVSSHDLLVDNKKHQPHDYSHRQFGEMGRTRSHSSGSSPQDLQREEEDLSDTSEDEQENNPSSSTIPMESQTIKRKRRQSIVRLDYEKLISDKGLPSLSRSLTRLKFKGHGFEREDLAKLIRFYEYWAYSLYPRVSFTAVIERVERLCSDKRLKVNIV